MKNVIGKQKNYLLKAKGAPARPDRPLADAGRQKEIDERLSLVEAKLKITNYKDVPIHADIIGRR